MKKSILSLIFATITYTIFAQQVIFSSSFENWSNNDPIDWVTGGTDISPDSVNQISTGAVFGNSAAELRNPNVMHRRLKTDTFSITAGQVYSVTYWVRGKGSIRAGLYDGATYQPYSTYDSINSTTWMSFTKSITANSTSSTAQFILSVRYTQAPEHLQVDSFVVTTSGGGSGITNTSIYNIQMSTTAPFVSTYNNQVVTTGGIVTAVKSPGYWLQSGNGPWSGIYVFDSITAAQVTMGDSVTMNALVVEYNTLTELKNVTNFVKVSSGNAMPQFTVISTGDANTEPYESVLIQCQSAKCTNPNSGFGQWKIYNAGDTVFVDDLMYTYNTPMLNSNYNVSGPLYYSFGEWKIEPRMASDVSLVTGISDLYSEKLLNIYPNPSNGLVNLNIEEEGSVFNIFDMNGKVIFSQTFNSKGNVQLKLNGVLSEGIYNAMIQEKSTVRMSKLMIVR
jgi:hypothetical protein